MREGNGEVLKEASTDTNAMWVGGSFFCACPRLLALAL